MVSHDYLFNAVYGTVNIPISCKHFKRKIQIPAGCFNFFQMKKFNVVDAVQKWESVI